MGSYLELLLSQPPRDRTIALIFPEVKDRYPFQIFHLDCCCFRKLFLQLISSFWFRSYGCLRTDFQRSIEKEHRFQSPVGRGAIDSFDGPSYDDGHRISDSSVINNIIMQVILVFFVSRRTPVERPRSRTSSQVPFVSS